MKLYYSAGACSLAPHIALYEAGLKFTTVPVNLRTKVMKVGNTEGDFLKVNPKGYVPTIELNNGEILSECAAILQYIADQAIEKNLIPRNGTFERYRCIEWITFVSTEIHKGIGPLWKPTTPDEYKQIVLATLHTRFELLNKHFEKNAFLCGANFTVADAYLFTVANWTHSLKISMTAYPKLADYLARVSKRPAVQQAMKAEGLLK